MLNTYIDRSTNIRYPEKTEHREIRAPTDESIKILREMEKEIIDSILDKIELNNNLFNSEIVVRRSGLDMMIYFDVLFKINGYISRFTLSYDYYKTLSNDLNGLKSLLSKFREDYIKKISEILYDNSFRENFHNVEKFFYCELKEKSCSSS